MTRRAQNVAAGCYEPRPSPWERIKAGEADYGDSFLFTARRHLVREREEEVVDADGRLHVEPIGGAAA